MFNRWFRSKKSESLPQYSALKGTASRPLPPELEEKFEGQSFGARSETIKQTLLETGKRPQTDAPLFTALIKGGGNFLIITLPENGDLCAPIFSTPFRAADYTRTMLDQGPRFQYLVSSPQQLVQVLRDLEGASVEWMTLDRCPRCSILNTIKISSIGTPDDAVTIWAITKSLELARAEVYFSYALECAHAGSLEAARDVTLEAVAHVTAEDPRLHLLLAQVAIVLRDGRLLEEAKAFLGFFSYESWRYKLDRDEESGVSDFAGPLNS
jgi:hypothetical protein